jgi:Ca2+-binding RTX toxin-like protein
MGAVNASGMTSSLSALNLDAQDVAKRMAITGGAGNDTILGGTGNDTITGGAGRDSLVGGTGKDVYVYTVGESNPVQGAAGASVGQDTVTVSEADDVIRVNVTSADNNWELSTHVLIGTANGAVTDLSETGAYTATTLLVQTGAVATGDNFDVAITKASAWSGGDAAARLASAQGIVAVNLTGTSVADTLTTGAQNDTISGAAGNDTIGGGGGNDSIDGGTGNDNITGGAGADTITGGTGNDTFVYTTVTDSNAAGGIDRITDLVLNGASGDLLDFTMTGTLTVGTATLGAARTAADSVVEIQALFNSTSGTNATKFTGSGNATALLVTATDGTLLVVDVNGDGVFDASDVVIDVTGVTTTSFTTACFI